MMHWSIYITIISSIIVIAFIINAYIKTKIPIELFDDVMVLNSCKNMTPKMLLKKFDNDPDKLVTTLIDHGIPPSLIENIDAYPIIASYLVSKGIIRC